MMMTGCLLSKFFHQKKDANSVLTLPQVTSNILGVVSEWLNTVKKRRGIVYCTDIELVTRHAIIACLMHACEGA